MPPPPLERRALRVQNGALGRQRSRAPVLNLIELVPQQALHVALLYLEPQELVQPQAPLVAKLYLKPPERIHLADHRRLA